MTTEELIAQYLERLKNPELKEELFNEALDRIEKLRALDLK